MWNSRHCLDVAIAMAMTARGRILSHNWVWSATPRATYPISRGWLTWSGVPSPVERPLLSSFPSRWLSNKRKKIGASELIIRLEGRSGIVLGRFSDSWDSVSHHSDSFGFVIIHSKYIALHDTGDVVALHDDDFICEFLVVVVMPWKSFSCSCNLQKAFTCA